MMSVYLVTGLLLLLLGIGNAVMALSATIDIAFIVQSLDPADLFSTPSLLGQSVRFRSTCIAFLLYLRLVEVNR